MSCSSIDLAYHVKSRLKDEWSARIQDQELLVGEKSVSLHNGRRLSFYNKWLKAGADGTSHVILMYIGAPRNMSSKIVQIFVRTLTG